MMLPQLKHYFDCLVTYILTVVKKEYLLITAIVCGAFLRFYQLSAQILVGDEWHAIKKALSSSYLDIITSFGVADHSIPITLYFKFLIDTVGLTEWAVKAPFLFFGVLAVIVLPISIRCLFNRYTSNVFACLIALSPILILFTRLARPYIFTVFLGFIAVIHFYLWWETNDKKHAIVYVLCTMACGVLLLVHLPFILGPFLFCFIAVIIGESKKKFHLIRLIKLGLVTTVLLLLFLAPPLINDISSLVQKSGRTAIGIKSIFDALEALAGMGGKGLLILILSLAIYGGVQTGRSRHLFALYIIFISLLQIGVLILVKPWQSDRVDVLARYMMPLIPVILVFTAAGMEALSGWFHGVYKQIFQVGFGIPLLVFIFVTGPIPKIYYRPNNTISILLYMNIFPYRHILDGNTFPLLLRRVPKFYEELGKKPPGTLNIIEAPFNYSNFHITLYQRVHRQNVIAGWAQSLCKMGEKELFEIDENIHLKSAVAVSDVEKIATRGVDFIVFHKYVKGEIRVPLRWYKHINISQCLEKYQNIFGDPFYEDEDIVVFKLSSRR